MTKRTEGKRELRSRARLRSEIVEMSRALHRVGMVSDAELEDTTLRMLGKDAFAKIKALSADEITAVRERAGVSQSLMAGYLNVAVRTVSQWERGKRRPTGTALKLLHVVKDKGLDTLR